MPRATRNRTGLTETQTKALSVLRRAYQEYVSVEIGERTDWTGLDRTGVNRATVSRQVANRLTFAGFTIISPAGWYLLLSPKGKAEVGIPT